MILKMTRVVGLTALMGLGSMAAAQESTDNRVAANTDWSVFQAESPTECFAVSAPKTSTLTDSSGNPATGRRGEIRLFVFYRPEAGVSGQVAFTGGYPFAGDSTVDVTIGGTTFQFFTEGEYAWPATPEDDARVVAAMKRGSDAVVKGRSGRGNVTTDTFSLLGFTASVEDAERRCSG